MRDFLRILLLTCCFILLSFSISQANEIENTNSFLVKTDIENFYVDFGDCGKLEEILDISPAGYFYSMYQLKDMIRVNENTIIAYSSIKLYIINNGQVSILNLEEVFSPYGIDIVKLSLLDNNLYLSLYITTEDAQGYILLDFNEVRTELTSNLTSSEFLKKIILAKDFYSYILFCNDTVYFFQESSNNIYLYEGLTKTLIGYMETPTYFKCSLIESIRKVSKNILFIKTIDHKNYVLDLGDGMLYFQSKC